MAGQGAGKWGAVAVINSAAPIRICDNGGWTDTWFAGHGSVFNIGVSPPIEVQVAVFPRHSRPDAVVMHAGSYRDRYAMVPGESRVSRHPLLEAAVDQAHLPDDVALEVSIHSDVPAGSSTGTSAAVTVALLAGLGALGDHTMTAHQAAYAAHRLETEVLGRQSGIQDQLCSAYGGVNFIEMDEYPHATVTQLDLPDSVRWELERRLSLVFLGADHDSSGLHEQVIADLERVSAGLEPLRRTAVLSRDALLAGDLAGLGRAMVANTEAQAALHTALVGEDATAVIEVAKAHGALGWKVNGAGGAGGSLTVLSGPSADGRRAMHRAIAEMDRGYHPIPVHLSREGLRVWRGALD